ncbi:MAG: hypothetical protein AAGA39_06400 [Pseudomonadota bacterium]
MTEYRYSLVAVVAEADRDEVNQFGVAMGHSGDEFCAPLSPTGAEPATHYALHSWVRDEAAAVWQGQALPALDPASGYDASDAALIMTKLVISVLDKGAIGSPIDHLMAVVMPMGLQLAGGD